MTVEQQLKLYENDVNAEANIRKAITDAYQDLRPESELVHTYENRQFPAFYEAMNGYGAGTGATDLSPTTLLQNAWGDAGRASTSAQVARDVFDVRKARMEDLIKSGMAQWQTGYTGAQNAWERWWAQKQHADQMAMQRAQLARMGGGRTVYNIGDPNKDTDALKLKAWQDAMRDHNKKYNAGADAAYAKLRSGGQSTGYSTPAPTYNSSSTFDRLLNNLRGL